MLVRYVQSRQNIPELMSLYEAIINSAENVSGMLYSGQGPGFCGAINYQFSRPRFPRPDRPVLGTDGANTCWW